MTSALLFYILTGIASLLAGSPFGYFFRMLLLPIRAMYKQGGGFLPGASTGLYFFGTAPSTMITLIFFPILLFLFLFIIGGLTHLCLRIFQGASRGFAATLLTFAYASAPNVFPLIGWVWSSVVLVIGLARAHRTQPWRVVAALTLESFALGVILLVPMFLLAMMFFRGFEHP